MDDLISRVAALDALDRERKTLIEQEWLGAEHIVVHHTRRLIENLPTVDAVPVEWLKKQFNDNPRTLWADMCRTVYTGWEKSQNPLWEEK